MLHKQTGLGARLHYTISCITEYLSNVQVGCNTSPSQHLASTEHKHKPFIVYSHGAADVLEKLLLDVGFLQSLHAMDKANQ